MVLGIFSLVIKIPTLRIYVFLLITALDGFLNARVTCWHKLLQKLTQIEPPRRVFATSNWYIELSRSPHHAISPFINLRIGIFQQLHRHLRHFVPYQGQSAGFNWHFSAFKAYIQYQLLKMNIDQTMRSFYLFLVLASSFGSRILCAQSFESFVQNGDDMASRMEYESAIAEYDKAIGVNPDLAKGWLRRGMAKAEMRYFEQVLADFKVALQIDGANPEVYVARANAFADQLDYANAMKDFNKALEIDSLSVAAYNGRGDIKKDRKDYLGAIIDYDHAIRVDPTDAFSFYARGISKIKSHQLEAGCLDLSKAGELGYEEAYVDIKKLCK